MKLFDKPMRLIIPLALIGLASVTLVLVIRLALDRIYYRGERNDHFDGQRFFNPEDKERVAKSTTKLVLGRAWNSLRGKTGEEWPASVPVTPSVPPERVDGAELRVTWIGHATVLIQTQGLNILTDPVWSARASPFARFGPLRVHAPGVQMKGLPRIDLVLVSHNHYDHMDVDTLDKLWRRDHPLIITSLGNDTILRGRGIDSQARDWGESITVGSLVQVTVERVHHWSSRWGADHRRALWSGFTITLPEGNIFFAGDTGWGDGAWVESARLHGPYRLALLPIGAYHPREIFGEDHLDPQQAVRVLRELGATQAMAIHWGTFALTDEGREDPLIELSVALAEDGIDPVRFRTFPPGDSWTVPRLDVSERPSRTLRQE